MASGTITYYGEQYCGFDYVTQSNITDAEILAMVSNGIVPPWDIDTEFRIAFLNGLVAGNTDYGEESPEEWRVYRENLKTGVIDFAGSVPGDQTRFADYAMPNATEFRYHLYPCTSGYIGNALLTGIVRPDWDNWALIVAEETENENEYSVKRIYEFALNLEVSPISNNTTIAKVETFTPYFKIQRSRINCWSGTLKSLIGYMEDCNHYYDDVDIAEVQRELSTDNTIKFLRDIKGHFWRVEITSPITLEFNDNIAEQPMVRSLEWTESGPTEGVSITGGVFD